MPVTDFPSEGDDKKVSLRNSQWDLFPLAYAEDLKENWPQIWKRGGNIKGNDQFRKLAPIARRGGNVETRSEENAVRLREAWVARHFKDFRLAGVVAQIKWLAVGSRGVSHMKKVINEEKIRLRSNKGMSSLRALGVINPELVTVNTLDDGTEILTFPVKALREQILECMNCLPGGEFVPASEIQKAINEWDGKPITIDHPVNESGELEFANRDDAFLESVKVGEISNPRFSNGFLLVDAHLNKTLASKTVAGQGIIDALITGKVDVEVSTGYGMELEDDRGIFEGSRYTFSQKNIEPDHLALLPVGTVGACSVEDGCGAARAARKTVAAASAAGGDSMNPKAIMDLVRSILKLNGADIEDHESNHQDVAPDAEVAGDSPSVNAAGLVDGSATEPPASGDDSEPGDGGTPDSHILEQEMKREKLIASLVAAASVPFAQDELEVMDDEKLTSLAALAGVDCGCEDAPAANSDATTAPAVESGDEDDTGEEGAVALSAEELLMIKQFISQAPALIDAANTAKDAEDAEREVLVASLVANGQCVISEADLRGMGSSALRSLSKSFEAVDYSGRGGPRSTISANAEEDGYMPLPGWGEKEGVIYG